jgi:UDP-3-O-[3-hydroxymyristoyl] glucosamine N-acyltransferase
LKKTSDNQALTLGDIARQVGAELNGNGDTPITGVAPIETAGDGDITFVANKAYYKHLDETKASAVILSPDAPSVSIPHLRHPNPYLTFARVIDLFYPAKRRLPVGIDSRAVVDDSAVVDPSAGIGPLCHVSRGASIGVDTELISSVFVGENATIGKNCLLYPGVCVLDGCKIGDNVIIHASSVIGSDGFGYAESETGLRKIQQVGWVEIDNDVEIGSNVSIDRGALGPTRIGQGTKIDNLVQIAHNVQTGRHCIIVGQVGIAGSTRLGNGVVLAGQVGVVGHKTIGDRVLVGAQSGVKDNLEAGKKYFGSPAREFMVSSRIEAAIKKLPDALKRIKKLEQKSKEE